MTKFLAHLRRLTMVFTVPALAAGLAGCGTQQMTNTTQPAPSTNQTIATSAPVSKSKHTVKHRKITALVAHQPTKPVHFSSVTVPILEYHNTDYVPNWPWALDPDQFPQEMAWLHQHQFHPITLQQLYDASVHHTRLPSRPVVITFDDGHESNYSEAYPILKKYGFVATENMVTGAIGHKGELTAKQLLIMQNSGVFSIESHTVHHPYLAKVSPSRVTYEVTQAKATLQKLLGRPVNFFCYPYGSYNQSVINAVRKAGYLMAVTSNYGYANPAVSGPLTLRRLSVHEGLTLAQFAARLRPSLAQPATPSYVTRS